MRTGSQPTSSPRLAGRPTHRARWTSVAVASWLLHGAPSLAQEPVREVQVPVDADGRVLEVTPDLRRAAGLLPDVEGFELARIFQQEDGTLVLEVSSREASRLVHERTVLSTAAAEQLRRSVSAALAASGGRLAATSEGRGGLVWGTTALGLGFYGWSLPVALHVDNGRLAVATYLLTAASSFYLPYRLTRGRSVTDAHRNLALWGATRGALYGGTLGFALTNRGGPPDPLDDDDKDWRVRLGVATVGSLAGGVLGFKAVDWTGVDEGTADLWGMLTDFSTASGFGVAYLLGLYDGRTSTGPEGFPVHEDPDLLPGNLLALGLTGAGFLGARAVGHRNAYTVGDVHVLRSFGLLGAQALLPIADLAAEDEGKAYAAAAILGAAPGLFLGNRLLRTQSFSSGDGLLVAAGHLAGGLLGAGLTYLVNPDTDRDGLIYLTTTAAGSAAGLLLTYRALADRTGTTTAARGPVERDARGRGGAQVSLNPEGLLSLLASRGSSGPPVQTPLLSVRW